MLSSLEMKIKISRKPADSYQHGDLREALVDAGHQLLSEGGVERLSLRAAAQLAGVSHAAPYRHYKDKDALLAAVGERGFRMLTQSMRAELGRSRAADASGKVVALGLGYLAFATGNPAYFQLIFNGLMKQPGVSPELAAAGNEAFELLRGTVAAGVSAGELRDADVDDLTLACWSMVHGLATLIVNGAIPQPAAHAQRQLTTRLLDLLATGIAAHG
jgi:AcrR family transcriptional regulator